MSLLTWFANRARKIYGADDIDDEVAQHLRSAEETIEQQRLAALESIRKVKPTGNFQADTFRGVRDRRDLS